MDFMKMWRKTGKDVVKTAIAGGITGVGISMTTTSSVGIDEAIMGFGTAIVSSIITGLFNWLKHKD